ncbi:pyruvate, water dikinase regulatory protein [Thermus islandicus]|uniref:pyruvate, water dikinase regulatory protein n=1 Tax=Thermus islandicus TaxID=540988 RepID=UPI0003B2E4CE|nr:pyruvate, water dikinase regulatory protein [Thermus islandicus]
MPQRAVFIVSDHTGITASEVARSLLAHFEEVAFAYRLRPFCDNEAKVQAVVLEILEAYRAQGARPIVFSTLTEARLFALLEATPALVFDLFRPYLKALEAELGVEPKPRVGRVHSVGDLSAYLRRMEAVEFALAADDGLGVERYPEAEAILVGVSRVGKTPTSLFLALHYQVRAANYPLAEDDFLRSELPKPIQPFRAKLFGLTIDPFRLHQIRTARKPGSRYASLEQCRYEVARAEALFKAHGIPYLDTTHASVEEIATAILQRLGLPRGLG